MRAWATAAVSLCDSTASFAKLTVDPVLFDEQLAALREQPSELILLVSRRRWPTAAVRSDHDRRRTGGCNRYRALAPLHRGLSVTFCFLANSSERPPVGCATGLAAVLPTWEWPMLKSSFAWHARRTQSYPRALAQAELPGVPIGPFTYLRSRRVRRRMR